MNTYFSLILFFICFSFQAQILTLTTTSKSKEWQPNKVVNSGEAMEWKASATGMIDQVVVTSGKPIFDLSVSRSSPVTILVTATDGGSGFTELAVNSLNITSLDVSNAVALKSLSCTDNQLKELNTFKNINLQKLFCHSNQLEGLDLLQNGALISLACFFNRISELDVSKNLNLSKLSCSNNLIKDLDLSNNTYLISVECDVNRLENLNVQNGNNSLIEGFKTTQNTNLFCIQVDDHIYSSANWKDIDPWSSFNKDCTFTNETPLAMDDQYSTTENNKLEVAAPGILLNDLDPDGDQLEPILIQDVQNGTLELNRSGAFIYIPNANFYGRDTFTYKVHDGEFDSNIATVFISVMVDNSPPQGNNDSYLTLQGSLLTVTEKQGVLSNDTDPDGDTLAASVSKDVAHGLLDLYSNGAFSYDPDPNFYGLDSFNYQVFDGFEFSKEVTVEIGVQAIHDIVMPNAFTPNNDGYNDFFKPEYKGMSKVQLSIFDTWGNLIFYEEASDLIGWDGNVNGKIAENGNYLYSVIAIPIEGENLEFNGLFTLIK